MAHISFKCMVCRSRWDEASSPMFMSIRFHRARIMLTIIREDNVTGDAHGVSCQRSEESDIVTESIQTDAVALLRESGRRITPERKLLLRIIESNAHLDAEQIYRIAQKERPQIGLATVYRTLNLLKELGIVCTTDLGENHCHYEVCSDNHLHLICSACGLITDIPIPKALLKSAKQEQFTVERVRFEIFGLCPACAKAASSQSKGSHDD